MIGLHTSANDTITLSFMIQISITQRTIFHSDMLSSDTMY
jgi:hypothetical protein